MRWNARRRRSADKIKEKKEKEKRKREEIRTCSWRPSESPLICPLFTFALAPPDSHYSAVQACVCASVCVGLVVASQGVSCEDVNHCEPFRL